MEAQRETTEKEMMVWLVEVSGIVSVHPVLLVQMGVVSGKGEGGTVECLPRVVDSLHWSL